MPLWASYLVKVYAWRVILSEDGILNWALGPLGIKGPGFGFVATWLVFSYLWLPYMILPIYAGLERIPASMLDASGDLGGRPGTTFRRVVLPLAFPAVVAGSIFTFSLTLGDYIAPQLVSSTQFIGNVVYANVGMANNLPLAAAFATVPVVRDDRLPARRAAAGRVRGAVMQLSGSSKWLLRRGPRSRSPSSTSRSIVILIYAFNSTRVQKWPPAGLTFSWFTGRCTTPACATRWRRASSAGCWPPRVALLLGTMASIAVARYRFFGREAVSFLVVLPIALPGIVTAMALNSTFTQVLGVSLGLLTIVIGHATFCIVVVFNNVVARLRRTSQSFEEASADLGANGLQTFRYVVFPQLRSALVAGALLAFALSFDEIIVTTFTAGQQQTLPIWIFANLSRPRQLPIVNVVAVLAILLSLIPVWIAQRITADPVTAGAARAEAGGEAGA